MPPAFNTYPAVTWRERFPFSLFFHPLNPRMAGIVVTVSSFLFIFWLAATLIAKLIVGPNSASDGSSHSISTSALPASCPRYGRRYGVMFDAGSTGSRVHVYDFTFEFDGTVKLHNELFDEVKPGLSSYAGKPEDAAKSIEELLKKSLQAVPEANRACTPLELKATAGLRLLGAQESQDLLNAVDSLFRRSSFFVPPNAVIVMDGKDEGPLAWVTVNFLLGTLFSQNSRLVAQAQQHQAVAGLQAPPKSDRVPNLPVAILDMGGASTQIVFVPFVPDAHGRLQPNFAHLPDHHRYSVKLFGQTHHMYQHSHLGYGLKEAGKSIAALATHRDAFECLPRGYEMTAQRKLRVGNTKGAVQSFHVCAQYARKFLNKNERCNGISCSFNGVFQPKLKEEFPGGEFFVFSYFYDRMQPFLPENGIMTVGDFKKFGKKICDSGDKQAHELEGVELIAFNSNKGTECMDFVYLYELLSTGYDLPDSQLINIKKKINGVETAWTLGAMMIAMQ